MCTIKLIGVGVSGGAERDCPWRCPSNPAEDPQPVPWPGPRKTTGCRDTGTPTHRHTLGSFLEMLRSIGRRSWSAGTKSSVIREPQKQHSQQRIRIISLIWSGQWQQQWSRLHGAALSSTAPPGPWRWQRSHMWRSPSAEALWTHWVYEVFIELFSMQIPELESAVTESKPIQHLALSLLI